MPKIGQKWVIYDIVVKRVKKGVQKWVKKVVKNRILGPRGLKMSEIWTFWSKNTLFLVKKSENFKR